MGRWKMFEQHPFSISSAPAGNLPSSTPQHLLSSLPSTSVFTLHIKPVGNYTRKLHEVANNWRHSLINAPVYIEGPYGTLSIDLGSYKQVVFIGGGIGITPLLSLMRNLIREKNIGLTNTITEDIFLFWSVRTNAEFLSFKHILEEIYDESTEIEVDFNVFITGKPSVEELEMEELVTDGKKSADAELPAKRNPENIIFQDDESFISVVRGRPNFNTILNQFSCKPVDPDLPTKHCVVSRERIGGVVSGPTLFQRAVQRSCIYHEVKTVVNYSVP
eukprot:CAMPEP_0174278734 /NCGR_PEP_ID=MMETSP0439-20130205/61644_1 /TAXON_ID=0 /ORGANISM="Stereomyxa ramosa, Strain Chinc5" /LENGTH=274 /DNA_ID=CAMNT_0015371181 /DNA_START=1218 /DNA_END=2038 /DNA_ORIENTATION=-